MIFACDYEDTYSIFLGQHPHEKETAAVKAFRAAGHLFGLVMERDCFEAMCNMGEYEEAYDFIVCSTGGCLVSRLPVKAGEFGAPERISTDVANPYYLCELYDLFASVGTSLIAIDVPRFIGGDAQRLSYGYDPSKGAHCYAHCWGGGGDYKVYAVSRISVGSLVSFSQCRGTFKNAITAAGVADTVNRRYYGKLRAYTVGNTVTVIPLEANKARGVMRFAELAGVPADEVWTFGNGREDICMLSEFNGIAKVGTEADAAGVAKYRAETVREALEIVLGR